MKPWAPVRGPRLNDGKAIRIQGIRAHPPGRRPGRGCPIISKGVCVHTHTPVIMSDYYVVVVTNSARVEVCVYDYEL